MTTSTSQTMALSLWLMTMSPMIMASFLCTYSVFFACLLGSYGVFVTVTSLNYGEFLGRARQCLQDILSLPMVVHVWIVAELLLPEYSAVIWWLYEVYFTLTTIFSFVKECVARFKTLGWKGKLLLLFVLLAIIVPFAEAVSCINILFVSPMTNNHSSPSSILSLCHLLYRQELPVVGDIELE